MTKLHHNDLFRPGTNSRLNACVGDNGGPYDFRAYAQGFFEASNRIVATLQGVGAFKVDVLVYPIAFNYRHGIELYVKHLLDLYRQIDSKANYKLTHSLMDKWGTLTKAAEGRSTDITPPESEIQKATALLEDFSQIDATGQVFRYPNDTKGNAHLKKQSLINVAVLGEAMQELGEFFDWWCFCLEEYFAGN